MNFTLTNSKLNISVSATGAELQTLTSAKSGEEFLWHGDSAFWSGRAPILFPIVGALKNARMYHNDKTYAIQRHGIARQQTFTCIQHEESHLLFRLESDQESLSVYPWEFVLEVKFTLNGNRLDIAYQVTHSSDQAQDEMLFTIGSHPAFHLPLDQSPFDDFNIRFSKPEQLDIYALDNEGLLSVQGKHYPLENNRLVLNQNTFDNDALVFKNIRSDEISLWQDDHERIRLRTGGAPHLGIWAKLGAPFVCIEPWYGYSDTSDASGQFADKPSLVKLDAGETFQTEWSIEVPSV